jgi:hypothetical protein
MTPRPRKKPVRSKERKSKPEPIRIEDPKLMIALLRMGLKRFE